MEKGELGAFLKSEFGVVAKNKTDFSEFKSAVNKKRRDETFWARIADKTLLLLGGISALMLWLFGFFAVMLFLYIVIAEFIIETPVSSINTEVKYLVIAVTVALVSTSLFVLLYPLRDKLKPSVQQLVWHHNQRFDMLGDMPPFGEYAGLVEKVMDKFNDDKCDDLARIGHANVLFFAHYAMLGDKLKYFCLFAEDRKNFTEHYVVLKER